VSFHVIVHRTLKYNFAVECVIPFRFMFLSNRYEFEHRCKKVEAVFHYIFPRSEFRQERHEINRAGSLKEF
jgi:hypothetical protein